MLTPGSETELAEMIAGADGPLAVQGGSTRGLAPQGAPLSTVCLSGITLYEPGALTLVAQSGTPLAEIEATLASENQMLAFEPPDLRRMLGTDGTPTIGGVVAANASGPRRIAASGACRDSVLGLRFVDGTGTVAKNGGRVMKNVTGYDLVKLLCGSYGTLGVVSEVSLKVLPRPNAAATLTIEGLSPDQAVPAMTQALNSPYEVSGVCFGPYQQEPSSLHLRLEGLETSVAYRAKELSRRLAGFGTISIERDIEAVRAGWAALRDLSAFAEMPFVACASLRPSAAIDFIDTISQTLAATFHLDWGGGRVWIGATEDQLRRNAGQSSNPDDGAANLLAGLRDAIRRPGGHVTVVKAHEALRAEMPVFQPEALGVAALTKGLRARFDPRGILNPGLMG